MDREDVCRGNDGVEVKKRDPERLQTRATHIEARGRTADHAHSPRRPETTDRRADVPRSDDPESRPITLRHRSSVAVGPGHGRLRGMGLADAPLVHVEDRAAWRAWLEANHATASGAWLVSWKRGHGSAVDYGEAVEEALCFGWVDSTAGTIDERRSKLYFAPRKANSVWAASNKERVARLIAEGLMAPAGLAVIERAKSNGSWTVLDSVEQGVVPDDLAASFAAHPPAAEHCGAFPKSVRRAILAWIAQAKRPETRAARVDETAMRAARNERANERLAERRS